MTLLSRKADYALLILQYLHVNLSGNAREIHEKFHLSKAFVANILKELVKAGFVNSTRGVKGGYVLARASATVTLAGNIDHVHLLPTCPPAEITAAVHAAIRANGGNPRFMVAPGCEITSDTPVESVKAFVQAATSFAAEAA